MTTFASGGGGGGSSPATSNPPTQTYTPPEVRPDTNLTTTEGRTRSIPTIIDDNDGTIETIQWIQVSGPPVVLENLSERTLVFTAPFFDQGDELRFRVTATDDDGASTSADSVVFIGPVIEEILVRDGYGYRIAVSLLYLDRLNVLHKCINLLVSRTAVLEVELFAPYGHCPATVRLNDPPAVYDLCQHDARQPPLG